MKKSLFVIGVAIAALSSCTKNEVLDIAESNTIRFTNSFIGKPTRANLLDKDNLNSFYVYGAYSNDGSWTDSPTDIFSTGENVYLGPEGWGYDNIEKRQEAVYSFAAYSDGGNTGKGSGKITAEGMTVTFTKPTESAKAKFEITDYETTGNNDLLVSISDVDMTSANQGVEFTFKHALSQVKFTLHNPLGNNPIEIGSFAVTGFGDKADLTYTQPAGVSNISWGTCDSGSNKTIDKLDVTTSTTDSPATGVYTVIPQTVNDNIEISITATLYNPAGEVQGEANKKLTATISADKLPEFKPGYVYNFKITLDMDYIYFDGVSVEDWVDYDANGDGEGDIIDVPTTEQE